MIPISQEQQELLIEIAEAERQLDALRAELAEAGAGIQALYKERERFHQVEQICASLDELSRMGGDALFWGSETTPDVVAGFKERARANIAEFQRRMETGSEAETALAKRIERQALRIESLQEELARLEEEERDGGGFAITREERALPYRAMVMPWNRQSDDERRFRRTLVAVLLLAVVLGVMVPYWELQVLDEPEPVVIPEHLVQLIKKEPPKPKPQPRPQEKQKPEAKQEKKVTEKKPKPAVNEKAVARKRVENTGVLAFRDSLSELLDEPVDIKLGSAATLSSKGSTASGESSRSLVLSKAQSTSGGINAAAISRGLGGSGGSRIGSGDKTFSRVESSIGEGLGDERPLSDGVGPSRTDEEIQIVFDRYKATLYRIYNRELRKDPSLKGKMILRLTIEPDGAVSMVKVESTDLDSPELLSNIVERVMKFNFGAKEGVPSITILYPIDFLPATNG